METTTPRKMVARFSGRCCCCVRMNFRDKQIARGEEVLHVSRGHVAHEECYERVTRELAKPEAERTTLRNWQEAMAGLQAALATEAVPPSNAAAARAARARGMSQAEVEAALTGDPGLLLHDD